MCTRHGVRHIVYTMYAVYGGAGGGNGILCTTLCTTLCIPCILRAVGRAGGGRLALHYYAYCVYYVYCARHREGVVCLAIPHISWAHASRKWVWLFLFMVSMVQQQYTVGLVWWVCAHAT